MALWALVLSWIYSSCFTLYIGKYYITLAPDTFSLTMKYNMFKGMVHFGWYIDTYISLHILFKILVTFGFFSSKPEQDSKGATRCHWSVRALFAFSTFFF